MIIYKSTVKGFLGDVDSNRIGEIMVDTYFKRTLGRVSDAEVNSWRNSLSAMERIVGRSDLPTDAGIAIEYNIPATAKRVDFIVSGYSPNQKPSIAIIELKQWESAEITAKDAIVKTRFGKSLVETTHPSYQAWSYAELLKSFNVEVYEKNIEINPCAYLHNYNSQNGVLNDVFYSSHTSLAPLFLREDADALRNFLSQKIQLGDSGQTIDRIEKSDIKPSKQLSESIAMMLKGNPEFTMIDEQKIVFEEALYLSEQVKKTGKSVLIVEGGPGTGKSVVAINLLVALLNKNLNVRYVSRNAAPRAVFESKLSGTLKKTKISSLFSGSSSFYNSKKNDYDVLLIDEAHRLNQFSGLYGNLGENQVKELIHASRSSVFFLDEDQRVTLKDVGTGEEIERWAKNANANITKLKLESQFRCNGSDGYLAWLDQILQIRETANYNLEGIDYDFKIFDSPSELRSAIQEKNKITNKARLVAGYCWEWKSKKDPKDFDITFPEDNFSMKWNLTEDGSLWILKPESIDQIGCIHTCQGLELDYVGVIIGPDITVNESGLLITDASKRAKQDNTIKGYKTLLKNHPEEGAKKIDMVIKNTYRTLMTRGMKGCYVYATDVNLREYLKGKV
ncbi:DUF2075 domain-containing protein [Leptospira biflexa]|uniref:DUF2075 domain-containing protein n=1 Tax=Leptospira biflexa TaxID=172 RepID=UPI001100E31B|nr:DUF2075 domain-containing protein [Leptospira biflexa]TGM51989.1 DUF2075 domain-containing protein [Leptospira biflexa]